jgi:hypothetical protein
MLKLKKRRKSKRVQNFTKERTREMRNRADIKLVKLTRRGHKGIVS